MEMEVTEEKRNAIQSGDIVVQLTDEESSYFAQLDADDSLTDIRRTELKDMKVLSRIDPDEWRRRFAIVHHTGMSDGGDEPVGSPFE